MTLHELSQLYYLNREIEADKARLEELRGKTGAPASPSLSGMPHGSGDNRSKVEREALEVVSLEHLIESKIKKCEAERLSLETYINTIPDSLTRLVFIYRFVNGLPWEQVAANIGGGNTADGVKKICYRYIDRVNQEEATE